MITSALKDIVLQYLIDNCELEVVVSGNTEVMLKDLEIDFTTLNAILSQFDRLGLLEELNLRRSSFHLCLLLEAHDFMSNGGFGIQKEIFESNFNKLLFEIEALKKEIAPDNLDKLNKVSGIVSTLLSGFALLKK